MPSRRNLLRTLIAGIIPFGGCNSRSDTQTEAPTYSLTSSPTKASTETPTDTPTKSPTETPTETPTKTPTETSLKTKYQYNFGEWHTTELWNGTWQLTIVSVKLAATYETDDGKSYQMPDDEQLLFAQIKIKHPNSETKVFGTSTDPYPWATIVDKQIYPERDKVRGIEVEELSRIGFGDIQRYSPEGQWVKPGQTEQEAIICVIPRSVSRNNLEIAYDGHRNDGVLYPVRWMPP